MDIESGSKASANPLRGDTNGPWQVSVASLGWKKIGNYYAQCLRSAYALRDAMTRFALNQVAYPLAALVLVPKIPFESEICSSDHKVSVVGLNELDDLLKARNTAAWSLDRWRRFAAHLRLSSVANMAAAFDGRLAAAEELIDRYLASFRRTYEPLAAELIPFSCTFEDKPASSDIVCQSAAARANVLLTGPSGCGKTLLAYRIALASSESGSVPILVRAKDFTGSLRDAVQGEVSLLDAPSAKALVNACQRLGRKLSFIVDGYNECIASERSRLTRSIGAAARRYEARIVVTTQSTTERGDLLDLLDACVLLPDKDTKQAIACHASGTAFLVPALQTLIDSVESGLEARLIGEVGIELAPTASRFAIFDAFVRRKLRDAAQEGIRALACMAGLLTDRISFSLSIRDLDRLADQESILPGTLRSLIDLRLLTVRGDRASFAHELFLSAFTAEAVVRRAAGRGAEILRALQSPVHAERKVLIVGAIDDDSLLMSVLGEIADAALIEACLLGQCGAVANAWASARSTELFRRMRAEADQVRFELSNDGFLGVVLHEGSSLAWTSQDKAFFAALGVMGSSGFRLDEILKVVATMDRKLEREHARLRDAASDPKVALRSGLFANVYVRPKSLAIGDMCVALHQGRLRGGEHDGYAQIVFDKFATPGYSNGQLFVLLALARHMLRDDISLAQLLPTLLREHWSRAPYHLKLDLLYAAQMCAPASDAERLAIIDALQDLPSPQGLGVSSGIMDALKSLGALQTDEAAHTDVVRSQIRELLSAQTDPDMQALACVVWFSQFDHPYEGAYYEAVAELSDSDRKSLLTMAAQGTDDDTSFFVSILIIELASFGDPASGSIISRWTAVPNSDSIVPQEAINIFVTAHIALARLGCAAHDIGDASSATQQAMVALGRILYWLNRCDLPMSERQTACQDGLAVLMRHELGVSAGALRELSRAYLNEGLDRLPGREPVYAIIGQFFASEIAEICRQALLHPNRQTGFSSYSSASEILDYAVYALGSWGSPADIVFLRQFANHKAIGATAVSAIKRLELGLAGI